MIDGDASYTTYFIQGNDIDNAFRQQLDDVQSLLAFIDAAEIGLNDLVFYYARETYLHAVINLYLPI